MGSPLLVGFSEPKLYLVFLVLFLFHQLPHAQSRAEPVISCDPLFRCGDITAGFPFWGGDRSKFCGHPWLELDCNRDANKTTLNFFGVRYNVLRTDNTNKTLKLSLRDFLYSLCLPYLEENTRWFLLLFEYLQGYKNQTIFYSCLPHFQYLHDSSCPRSGGGKNCDPEAINVTVPEKFVLGVKAGDFHNAGLEKAVKEGFWVKPKIYEKECEECLSLAGTCRITYTHSTLIPQFCCQSNSSLGSKCRSNPQKATGINQPQKIVIGAASLTLIIILILFLINYKSRQRTLPWMSKRETDLSNQNLEELIPLKRYSYTEVKKITKSFKHIIGRGGFGTVYGGELHGGCKVAVKVLKESNRNGEDFINEVASMSKTSHTNIVSLLGFCYEGFKRAIIYEYLENGSLDKFILSKNSMNTDWRTLYEIALGVAHGLEYLHYQCKSRIVHFDIKPQNILLDDNLCPKVSDFGLAKLCKKRESTMSLLDARGTYGYMAPEVFSRNYGRVSYKSDVYSYGMLILEMIGARNNVRAEKAGSNDTSVYFPEWIYTDLERGENMVILGDDITKEEKEMAKKMILVGLWCIQSCPSNRPPMNKVVEMIEGSLDALEVPPKPILGSAVPFQESHWPAKENSSFSSEA